MNYNSVRDKYRLLTFQHAQKQKQKKNTDDICLEP